MSTKLKYSVRITYPGGDVSYLTYRDRTEWTKRTAEKHCKEFMQNKDRDMIDECIVVGNWS